MELVPYGPEMAREMTDLYNGSVAGLPHCYPVSEKEFADALLPAARSDSGTGLSSHEKLLSESAIVAREAGRIVGYIHTALSVPGKEVEPGLIRYFTYERGRRAVGQALLEAGERWLRERGVNRVGAFHPDAKYRFYHVAHAGISDQLDHVTALLKWNGYGDVNGEVVLDWPAYDPVPPTPCDVKIELRLNWIEGRGKRPNLDITAYLKERSQWAGHCQFLSGGEFSDAEEAQDWAFCDGLFIDESLHGKGLGRYLLRLNMREMHGIGYRNASISTSWTNYRALLFYANYGFRAVDWTHNLARDLNGAG